MTVPDTARHGARTLVVEQYDRVGFNYRMTDLQAAVGIEQMKKLDRLVARRRALAARYDDALRAHPWLETPYVPEEAEANYQSYALRLRPGSPVRRNDLVSYLLAAGVGAKPGVMTAHREPAYRNRGVAVSLPRTEAASDGSLLVPLYPDLTEEEQDRVVAALYEAFALRPVEALA
jgi:perosamine synthetase